MYAHLKHSQIEVLNSSMFNLDTHATFQNGLLVLHLSRAEKTYVFATFYNVAPIFIATFYNVAPIFTTTNPKGSKVAIRNSKMQFW